MDMAASISEADTTRRRWVRQVYNRPFLSIVAAVCLKSGQTNQTAGDFRILPKGKN
jgi:hypothetical protein